MTRGRRGVVTTLGNRDAVETNREERPLPELREK
jgi:hypothetical protein